MRHAPEPDCAVNDEFAAENEGGGAADDEGGGEPQRIFPAVLHLLPDFGFRIAAPVALLKADVPGDVGQQPAKNTAPVSRLKPPEQKADRCHGQRDRRHDRQVEPRTLLCTESGAMTAESPRISAMLQMFEPITLPMLMSLEPASAA